MKKQDVMLILVGRKMNGLAERLSPVADFGKVKPVFCSDIFDTIVKINNTSLSVSEKVICIDSKEAGKFAISFFEKLNEYGITCCCLDEDGFTKNLSLPDNVVIAEGKNRLETILKNILPAGSVRSSSTSGCKQQKSVKTDFAPSRNEINALFQESEF